MTAPEQTLRFTCIKCHQPTDAPLCERCEAEAEPDFIKHLDTEANGSARERSLRAMREGRR